MKIEHLAYMYPEPAQAAAWYVENLGFRIVRRMEESPFTHFLSDSSGQVMVEFYNNPAAEVLGYAGLHPLQLHLALVSANPQADRDRLVQTGATVARDSFLTPEGDELVMLRDPWGFAIQLCKRAQPML